MKGECGGGRKGRKELDPEGSGLQSLTAIDFLLVGSGLPRESRPEPVHCFPDLDQADALIVNQLTVEAQKVLHVTANRDDSHSDLPSQLVDPDEISLIVAIDVPVESAGTYGIPCRDDLARWEIRTILDQVGHARRHPSQDVEWGIRIPLVATGRGDATDEEQSQGEKTEKRTRKSEHRYLRSKMPASRHDLPASRYWPSRGPVQRTKPSVSAENKSPLLKQTAKRLLIPSRHFNL